MNWKGKKVLVTGACGFIGSHLVEALLARGADVTAFVYYNSFNSWGWLDTLDEKKKSSVRVVAGDVRDPESVGAAVAEVQSVFHLAALIAIPYSYRSPQSYFETNVLGTLNVLQAARKHEQERIVLTSTSEVYGTAQVVPIVEAHPLQAQSPYSASKIGADAVGESFYRSFGLPVITARPFNSYGPRQSARAVIPTIMSQLLSGSKRVQLGALEPTRDLTFVEDTVEGIIRLAECEKAVGSVTNIGTGTEISIGDLAKKIGEVSGRSFEVVSDTKRLRPEKSEVERLCASQARLKELTDWVPRTELSAGLTRTWQWIQENRDHYKPEQYCL